MGVHRAERRARHPCRSCAFCARLRCVIWPILISFQMVLLMVPLGLPRFLFPFGAHSHACLGSLSGSILRAWPRYCHRLFFITFSMSSTFALSSTVSFFT